MIRRRGRAAAKIALTMSAVQRTVLSGNEMGRRRRHRMTCLHIAQSRKTHCLQSLLFLRPGLDTLTVKNSIGRHLADAARTGPLCLSLFLISSLTSHDPAVDSSAVTNGAALYEGDVAHKIEGTATSGASAGLAQRIARGLRCPISAAPWWHPCTHAAWGPPHIDCEPARPRAALCAERAPGGIENLPATPIVTREVRPQKFARPTRLRPPSATSTLSPRTLMSHPAD